eukprot:10860758-Alexandrium_andersonii.AAC.1
MPSWRATGTPSAYKASGYTGQPAGACSTTGCAKYAGGRCPLLMAVASCAGRSDELSISAATA